MSDHMTDQLRAWSHGQAMLPPDPGGHNRALDRGAAEHLREVAPGLAPDASGYPFLSDERPPAADKYDARLPCPGCGVPLPPGAHHVCYAPPAPPAEATGESVETTIRNEVRRHPVGGYDYVHVERAAEAKGEQPCACAGHREPGDPLICRKRYSEMLEAIYEDDYGDTAELRDALLRHDLALRARAREAEERAEQVTEDRNSWRRTCETVTRERDEARGQRAHSTAEVGRLGLEVARLRDDFSTERAARVAAEAGWDAALTEANDLRLRVERLVEGAAKLTERAEEAEEEVRLADFRVKAAESRSDDFAARLAAAEAEVATLKTVALANQNAAIDLSGKLAAAEAEVKRLRLAWDDPEMDATDGAHPAWWRGNDAGVAGAVGIVTEALDEPLPLAGCVGGADLERVRQRIAALRERAERLEETGDRMAASIGADWPALTRAWAAAKGTK